MKNIEIKARTTKHTFIREVLHAMPSVFKGTDYQRDTYFNVPQGRLKLRDGNIEKALISYNRNDQAGPKKSDYRLHHCSDPETLRECLTHSLGVLVDVKKVREIYYVDQVKVHLDVIDGLGQFVEIEVRDETDQADEQMMLVVCRFFMAQFGIDQSDLIENSYSDMLLNR